MNSDAEIISNWHHWGVQGCFQQQQQWRGSIEQQAVSVGRAQLHQTTECCTALQFTAEMRAAEAILPFAVTPREGRLATSNK